MAIKISKTPTKGYKYVLTAERGKDDAFALFIRPLSTKDLLTLEDRMIQRKGEDVFIAQGAFAFRVAQLGIVGWENMLDEKDKQVKFEKGADGNASESIVACIPADMVTEAAGVIGAITRDPTSIQTFFPE